MSELSNIGRFVALVIATKAITLLNIPTTMMALTQLAAEEVWQSVVNHDYGGALNITGDGIRSTMEYGLYNRLIWMTVLMYFFWKLPISKFINWNKQCYDTLKNTYQLRVKCMRSSLIMSSTEQTLIVNNHLIEKQLFLCEYDRYQYFLYEYERINRCNIPSSMKDYRNIYIPNINTRYEFNDIDANVHGYIIWLSKDISVNISRASTKIINDRSVNVTEDVIVNVPIPILKLVINKSIAEYLQYIKSIVSKSTQTQNLMFCHLAQGLKKDTASVRIMSTYNYVEPWNKYFIEHYAEQERALD